MTAPHGYRVGVLGANGRLGRALLGVLDRDAPSVERCIALTTDPGRAGQAVRAGSHVFTIEQFDPARSDLDLIFSAVPPPVLGSLLGSGFASPLVINAAGATEDDAAQFQITDVDPCEPLPDAADGSPRVITAPRWSTTQLARLLRPIVAEVDLTRVRVSGAPLPDGEIDERLAGRELKTLLGHDLAFGYQAAPVPDDGVAVQMSADVFPALGITSVDRLSAAPGVAVRLGIGGASAEARGLAAAETIVVTRVLGDPDQLGYVQIHWTAAAAARGAALQAMKLATGLAERGCILARYSS
jgi:hypothetical protein